MARSPGPGGQHRHVFVSYARDDTAAVQLIVDHLRSQDVPVWVDWEIQTGERWRDTIRRQIETCAAVLLVMTLAAGRSAWVSREVRYALGRKRPVRPLLLEGEPMTEVTHLQYTRVNNAGLPDADLIHSLKESAPVEGVARVWTIPEPPSGMAQRPELADALIARLISPDAVAVGVSTALFGAGGFGKTTLARQVCADPRIRAHYADGVWVTLGEASIGASLTDKINDVCYQLSGERPNLADPEQAGLRFAAILDERWDTLLVIDDVWSPDQLRPFLLGRAGACSRIVTTRRPSLLPAEVRDAAVHVDQLTELQTRALLTEGLPTIADSDLAELIRLSGRWPLLLQLARRRLVADLRDGREGNAAVGALCRRLRSGGPTVLNLRDETSRDRAVAASVSASMDRLDSAERDRFVELGIFAADADITRDVLQLLWGTTGGLDELAVEQLMELLADLGLLAEHQHNRLRLHDVIRGYLRHVGRPWLTPTNGAFVDAARALLPESALGGTPWWLLREDAGYLWQHLAYHLNELGPAGTAQVAALLSTFDWLHAKVHRSGLAAMLADFAYAGESDVVLLVEQAVRLSGNVLAVDPSQLASQLVGRLRMLSAAPAVAKLLEDAHSAAPWLRPRNQCLHLPGDALLRIMKGHSNRINALAVTPDGRHVVSASSDHTLIVWDLSTAASLQTLTGHREGVNDVAITTDGRSVLSASGDISAMSQEAAVIAWDLETATEVRRFEFEHAFRVTAVCVSGDGGIVAFAIDEGFRHSATVEVWQLPGWEHIITIETEVERLVLSTHGTTIFGISGGFASSNILLAWRLPAGNLVSEVDLGTTCSCIAITPDGEQLILGLDSRVSVRQARDLAEVAHCEGHTARVRAVAVTPDGRWVVSGSDDRTVRVWERGGGAAAVLTGHTAEVEAVATTPDSRSVVSSGRDRTLRVWDIAGAGPVDPPPEPYRVTSLAMPVDGRQIIAGCTDGGIRTWPLDGEMTAVGTCGQGSTWVSLLDSGSIAACSADGTVVMWTSDGRPPQRYSIGKPVVYAAFSRDGTQVIAAHEHAECVVWDLRTGRKIAEYGEHREGHEERQQQARSLSGWSDDFIQDLRVLDDGTVLSLGITYDRGLFWLGPMTSTSAAWNPHDGSRIVFRHWAGTCGAACAAGDRVYLGLDALIAVLTRSGHCTVGELTGHTDTVQKLAASPNGSLVVSYANDNTMRVWDCQVYTVIATFYPDDTILALTVSDDGLVVAADDAGRIMAFDLIR